MTDNTTPRPRRRHPPPARRGLRRHRDDARRAGPQGRGAREPRGARRRARGRRHESRRMPRTRRSTSSATCASWSRESIAADAPAAGVRRPRAGSARTPPSAPPGAPEARLRRARRRRGSIVASSGSLLAGSARPACCRCRSASRSCCSASARPASAWIVGDSLVPGDDDQPSRCRPTRPAGYALASFLAVYGLGFAGLVALGALPMWAIVFAAVGVIAGDHPLRVPRRDADEPPQGLGPRRRSASPTMQQPLRGGARDRRPLRHLHRRHLDRHVRRLRRAELHGRLVVVVARVPRRRSSR